MSVLAHVGGGFAAFVGRRKSVRPLESSRTGAAYASARKSAVPMARVDPRRTQARLWTRRCTGARCCVDLSSGLDGRQPDSCATTGPATDTIDAPLVRQAQIGDRQAVADLLRLSRPLARRAVARQISDYQSVDDLAQTTLLVVLTGLPYLRAPEAYVGWVQGIVRNVCRKELRRNESAREAATRLAQDRITAPTRLLDPLEEALRLEVRTHLEDALACLQGRYQVVIIMRALEGRTYDDIGAALNVPRQIARLWYFRARQRLQAACTSDEVLVRASSQANQTSRTKTCAPVQGRYRSEGVDASTMNGCAC